MNDPCNFDVPEVQDVFIVSQLSKNFDSLLTNKFLADRSIQNISTDNHWLFVEKHWLLDYHTNVSATQLVLRSHARSIMITFQPSLSRVNFTEETLNTWILFMMDETSRDWWWQIDRVLLWPRQKCIVILAIPS